MADTVMTVRLIVKEIAHERGVHASFMPKPLSGVQGSGMHTHFSLFEGDRNAFADTDNDHGLSDVGRQFIAGVLQHAREITAVTNQWVNSYKRLVAGYEAPVNVSWAYNNRSALVRVPIARRGKVESTRFEYRAPDPACNPYLAFSVVLAAGLEGIEKGYELGPEAAANLFTMTPRGARLRRHPVASLEPARGARGDGGLRARRRDAGRARLRVVPSQQAGRVGGLHARGHALRAGALPSGPLSGVDEANPTARWNRFSSTRTHPPPGWRTRSSAPVIRGGP